MSATLRPRPASSKSALLGVNAKLRKTTGVAKDYAIAGVTLAPHSLSGHNVCPSSTVGCRASCNLWFAGQRVVPAAREKAQRDTRWLFSDRPSFIAQLHHEIGSHVAWCDRNRLTALVRLNVASDLDWTDVINAWPRVQFYDYTKVRSRFRAYLEGKLPSNYALTYSASERSHPATLASYLRSGGNVAVVMDVDYYPAVGRIGALPQRLQIWGHTWPVVDGDQHDVRLPSVDGRGRIIGLRLKGTNAAKERGRKTGFARHG